MREKTTENIRNFVIIAHIDHGKSTLADRLLEVTGTVEARRMRPQYLDQLELERERGITIKMAPVRMVYHPEISSTKSQISNKAINSNNQNENPKNLELDAWSLGFSKQEFVLNLIDTPGHSDFAYEVSRALHAVEGAILLVDVTKGIQAQTLSNLHLAEKAGLKIIGAVNKIDLGVPQVEKVIKSLAELLGVSPGEIFRISGKTGEGVPDLLRAVIEKVPPPAGEGTETKALIFDSLYDEHKGILAFVRLFGGRIVPGEEIFLLASGARFKIKEVGAFLPHLKAVDSLSSGEIGYIATGLKETDLVRIGDTVAQGRDTEPLQGYREPAPVVFISFYPDGATEFDDLKSSLEKLKLNDPALYFEPEANEALGRGLKVGFLGQLHFEITASRLRDEFDLDFLTSFPSVAYRIREQDKEYVIKQAKDFPASPDRVFQPMIRLEILSPERYVSSIVGLKTLYSLTVAEIKNLGENFLLVGEMPLAELLRDFDDQLKSLTAGFASFSYELAGEAPAEVEKLEIIVAADVVEALTRIVPEKDLEREARTSVEKLKKLLPRMQFAQAIQARARGRIIARETIPALRKDVTGYLYGGDRSRKMKLWKKQKRGKERLKETGRVNLPVEVFREILKK